MVDEPARKRVSENESDEVRAQDSQQRSESGPKQTLESCFANLDLEQNDGHAGQKTRCRAIGRRKIKRMKEPCGGCKQHHE